MKYNQLFIVQDSDTIITKFIPTDYLTIGD